jgi:hypothetical protein
MQIQPIACGNLPPDGIATLVPSCGLLRRLLRARVRSVLYDTSLDVAVGVRSEVARLAFARAVLDVPFETGQALRL